LPAKTISTYAESSPAGAKTISLYAKDLPSSAGKIFLCAGMTPADRGRRVLFSQKRVFPARLKGVVKNV
jgi:hypothetical protein